MFPTPTRGPLKKPPSTPPLRRPAAQPKPDLESIELDEKAIIQTLKIFIKNEVESLKSLSELVEQQKRSLAASPENNRGLSEEEYKLAKLLLKVTTNIQILLKILNKTETIPITSTNEQINKLTEILIEYIGSFDAFTSALELRIKFSPKYIKNTNTNLKTNGLRIDKFIRQINRWCNLHNKLLSLQLPSQKLSNNQQERTQKYKALMNRKYPNLLKVAELFFLISRHCRDLVSSSENQVDSYEFIKIYGVQAKSFKPQSPRVKGRKAEKLQQLTEKYSDYAKGLKKRFSSLLLRIKESPLKLSLSPSSTRRQTAISTNFSITRSPPQSPRKEEKGKENAYKIPENKAAATSGRKTPEAKIRDSLIQLIQTEKLDLEWIIKIREIHGSFKRWLQENELQTEVEVKTLNNIFDSFFTATENLKNCEIYAFSAKPINTPSSQITAQRELLTKKLEAHICSKSFFSILGVRLIVYTKLVEIEQCIDALNTKAKNNNINFKPKEMIVALSSFARHINLWELMSAEILILIKKTNENSENTPAMPASPSNLKMTMYIDPKYNDLYNFINLIYKIGSTSAALVDLYQRVVPAKPLNPRKTKQLEITTIQAQLTYYEQRAVELNQKLQTSTDSYQSRQISDQLSQCLSDIKKRKSSLLLRGNSTTKSLRYDYDEATTTLRMTEQEAYMRKNNIHSHQATSLPNSNLIFPNLPEQSRSRPRSRQRTKSFTEAAKAARKSVSKTAGTLSPKRRQRKSKEKKPTNVQVKEKGSIVSSSSPSKKHRPAPICKQPTPPTTTNTLSLPYIGKKKFRKLVGHFNKNEKPRPTTNKPVVRGPTRKPPPPPPKQPMPTKNNNSQSSINGMVKNRIKKFDKNNPHNQKTTSFTHQTRKTVWSHRQEQKNRNSVKSRTRLFETLSSLSASTTDPKKTAQRPFRGNG